jgi:hypothetical protein
MKEMGQPRVFISFAKEDIRYRDFLVGQARNSDTPFTFQDMSLAEPFDSKWKTRCREKIRSCHGFIALLSKKTWRADGARWEMQCAAEEGIPTIGIHIHSDDKGAVPLELRGRVIEWRWTNIANFIKQVDSKRSLLDKLFT